MNGERVTAIRKKGFLFSAFLYAFALPVSMALTNAALALALAFFVSDRESWNRLRKTGPRALFWLVAFFLWAVLTQWLAGDPPSWDQWGAFSKLWNFLPLLIFSCSPLGFLWKSRILWTWVWTCAIVAALGIVQRWFDVHYFFEGWFGSRPLILENRFYGFQSHPLHSGALYAFAFLAGLSLLLFTPQDSLRSLRKKGLRLAACGTVALGVLFTESRSYLLAAALGGTFILFRKGWKYLAGGALLVALGIALAASVDAGLRARLATLQISHTDLSARMRTWMWRAAAQMLRDHPVSGIGYHHWKDRVAEYSKAIPEWQLDAASFAHAHNSALTVAAETGLPGLILFLGFWASLLREQWKRLRSAGPDPFVPAGFAAILAALFAGLFEHNLLTATVTLALFFLLGISRAPETQEP